MATSQIVVIIVAIIGILLVLGLAKKTMKIILTLAILVFGGISVGLLSPKQVIDTAQVIKDKGIETYEKFASASDNIKVSGDSLMVRMGDTWVDLNAINNFDINGNTVSVNVGGNTYQVTDETVAKLFQTFK